MSQTSTPATGNRIPTAEKVFVWRLNGVLHRPAETADVEAGYPQGNVAALCGKRIVALVPLIVETPAAK
jgi:hypothetical protein